MATTRKESQILDKNGIPIIQKIEIRSTQRGTQDISSWRSAMQTAESVTSPRRSLLYDLYNDLELDGHLSSVLDKRINVVKNAPLIFIENGVENKEITKLLKTETNTNFIGELLKSKFWGFTMGELTIVDKTKLEINLIPRKHVVPEYEYIALREGDSSGISFTDEAYGKYLIQSGQKRDLGLLLKAAQYVIYKRGGFGDWSQFAEIFGMPFRIGKYDGYDEQTRHQLEQALANAGSASYAVIPRESDIEFLQNYGNAGSNVVFESLIEACNTEISKLILGNTLTTESGGVGSQALGTVHQSVEDQIHYADKMFILFNLNEKLTPLLKQHGYPINELGEWTYEESANIALKERIEIDMKVSEKVPISDDYWYKTYGIEKPEDYDKLKKEMEAKKAVIPAQPTQNNNGQKGPGTNQPKNITTQNNQSKKNQETWSLMNKLADLFSSNAH
jgi:hypothetical protein